MTPSLSVAEIKVPLRSSDRVRGSGRSAPRGARNLPPCLALCLGGPQARVSVAKSPRGSNRLKDPERAEAVIGAYLEHRQQHAAAIHGGDASSGRKRRRTCGGNLSAV